MVDGSLEARVEFLLSVIELLFLTLTVEALQEAKCVKTRCLQEWVGHLEPQYRRVTDRQTDGIAVASAALAMRALRRAVKRSSMTLNKNSTRAF